MNYNDLHLVYNRHRYELPPVQENTPTPPPPEPQRMEPEVVVQQVVVSDPALEARCQELEHVVDVYASMMDKPTGLSPDRFPLMHIQYAAGYALGKFLGIY